jgi:hypothetical protein
MNTRTKVIGSSREKFANAYLRILKVEFPDRLGMSIRIGDEGGEIPETFGSLLSSEPPNSVMYSTLGAFGLLR